MKEFINTDLLKSNLKNAIDRYSQVEILSEYILDHLGADSVLKSKSTKDIINSYEELCVTFAEFIPKIPTNTFNVNLSRIASEQGSKINCPGRKQGYYLEGLIQKLEEIEKIEKQSSQEGMSENPDYSSKIQEKNIYPIVKDWLF